MPMREPLDKVAPRNKLNQLNAGQRRELLEWLAPGQSSGRNQSGYIWGTLTDSPRYEYGESRTAGNPEVVVSEVRTPPELETRYLYTQDARNPFIEYKIPPTENTGLTDPRAVGPSWGARDLPTGGQLAGRRKRDVSGDISFRGDLIEKRGGFSLADAQAVQGALGLPVSFTKKGQPPHLALQEAVESIRQSQNLASHGEVVEKYARSLPRLGSTTAPRQPATGWESAMELDTNPGITDRFKRSFDVPEALRSAGYESTRTGLKEANRSTQEIARKRINNLSRTVSFAPGVGAVMGLADPEAARLLGAATRETGSVQGGLVRDAVRVYGQNAVVGSVQGGLVGGALALAPKIGLGKAAVTAGIGLTTAAPLVAGAAAVKSVDEYLKGATDKGLAVRAREVQRQAQPALTNPVNSLFPAARSVPARTPSGVAELRQSSGVNPVVREARNRVALFRENFNPLKGDLGVTELLLGRGRESSGSGNRSGRPVGSRAVLNGKPVVWTGDSYGWQSPASAAKIGVR